MPTPQELARFHARVGRHLAYYRGCLARIDGHTPLHVTVGVLVARLDVLNAYLATKPAVYDRGQLAAMGGDTPVWRAAAARRE